VTCCSELEQDQPGAPGDLHAPDAVLVVLIQLWGHLLCPLQRLHILQVNTGSFQPPCERHHTPAVAPASVKSDLQRARLAQYPVYNDPSFAGFAFACLLPVSGNILPALPLFLLHYCLGLQTVAMPQGGAAFLILNSLHACKVEECSLVPSSRDDEVKILCSMIVVRGGGVSPGVSLNSQSIAACSGALQ